MQIPAVLQNAVPAQLEQAVADNHAEMFMQNTIACGGAIQRRSGLTWTYSGPEHGAAVLFPAMDAAAAGPQLDEMMDYYRMHPPKGAGCWSLMPAQPHNLGVLLLARGFQPGWQPQWMALDLNAMHTGHARPAGLQVTADNETPIHDIKDLPYANSNSLSAELKQQYPDRAQRFIATYNDRVVAHSEVFFTTGPLGVAGIYSVGVLPRVRNKGVGKAVVLAACQYAQQRGYRYAVLNATGRRMYEQVGFRFIGYGNTWWLQSQAYRTHPLTREQVALAEAVGNGNIAMLEALSSRFSTAGMNAPMANGLTLIQLAVHCRQVTAAEWLMGHGAAYTVLDAWDLGKQELAAAMLKAQPALANQQYGEWQATLLHLAAERNDVSLAQLALSACPDLEIRDKTYNGTALGWALHLGSTEIAEMIQKNVK
ncbi:MAG TPA: GNAT family N-acetyltransferase [Chitinophaga sp.]|uniref:GNAT family N-acetyltransferase n=1 Tax=Chitinophaga sp. TaxID=1869181 RepID=UPI002DB96538|nr:GNAT family N-acetyltransferase [Chitinophaga sp.]HEU4553728.1 GNAT family N-acetyltransferase [Chitinophaga sp.]